MRFIVVCFLLLASQGHAATACPFDRKTLSFEGSALEQAYCLLREVKQHGHLGPSRNLLPIPLPEGLSSRIGQTNVVDSLRLSEYLSSRKIPESQVGGALDKPLSYIEDAEGMKVEAAYFVIHDTSTPLPDMRATSFPKNINEGSWRGNRLKRWDKGQGSAAHAFINRLGQSIAPISFDRQSLSTEFEQQWKTGPGLKGNRLRGLFLHIELVQPRRSSKADGSNDAIAPEPGFAQAQYDRLALLYVAASMRAGRWLIPAFHAALDAGIAGGHDDPQKFDLEKWSSAVDQLATTIGSTKE